MGGKFDARGRKVFAGELVATGDSTVTPRLDDFPLSLFLLLKPAHYYLSSTYSSPLPRSLSF